MIYQCAEHAVSASLFIRATPIGVSNPTGMVIDSLRRLFDVSYLKKSASGFTQHDWHANAVFILSRCEKALGKHSLEWSAILVRHGDPYDDDVKMAAMLLADGIESKLEQHIAEKLIWNVQTQRPSLRQIERWHGIGRERLRRERGAINRKIHAIESRAWCVLNDLIFDEVE